MVSPPTRVGMKGRGGGPPAASTQGAIQMKFRKGPSTPTVLLVRPAASLSVRVRG